MSNFAISEISVAQNVGFNYVKNLNVLKMDEMENPLESGTCVEVKFILSGKRPQNTL